MPVKFWLVIIVLAVLLAAMAGWLSSKTSASYLGSGHDQVYLAAQPDFQKSLTAARKYAAGHGLEVVESMPEVQIKNRHFQASVVVFFAGGKQKPLRFYPDGSFRSPK